MLKKLKQQFRILPMVIFMAVLMLSVRLNNIFDLLKNPYANRLSISQSLAFAEEKNAKETSELTNILENGTSAATDSATGTPAPNTGFTQSEIMILQELAERREALDIRSREIDKKAVQLKVAEQEIDKRLKQLQEHEQKLRKLIQELNDVVVVFLNYVVNKFGPFAIFVLLVRTFATYGINHLRPAFAYVVAAVALLLLYLVVGYPLIVAVGARKNPITFLKKISKVAVFGFSTSSSAAALPLNYKTCTEDLGVDETIASFVLPLGMTINMNGTAIMQVIATVFIAGCAGYSLSLSQLIVIAVLALIASAGTPAAPGAGAIVLFTILSGVGFVNEGALLAYSLILAINRPIEMLVTALNVVGDAVTSICVAKSEGLLDSGKYDRP